MAGSGLKMMFFIHDLEKQLVAAQFLVDVLNPIKGAAYVRTSI